LSADLVYIADASATSTNSLPAYSPGLSLDGLGLLSFESVLNRDYPVVFATLYIFSLVGLVVNLISDLTYTWVDPRIDFETREV
jgi:ABC-type microcin C transport system permease subunit YejB